MNIKALADEFFRIKAKLEHDKIDLSDVQNYDISFIIAKIAENTILLEAMRKDINALHFALIENKIIEKNYKELSVNE